MLSGNEIRKNKAILRSDARDSVYNPWSDYDDVYLSDGCSVSSSTYAILEGYEPLRICNCEDEYCDCAHKYSEEWSAKYRDEVNK